MGWDEKTTKIEITIIIKRFNFLLFVYFITYVIVNKYLYFQLYILTIYFLKSIINQY